MNKCIIYIFLVSIFSFNLFVGAVYALVPTSIEEKHIFSPKPDKLPEVDVKDPLDEAARKRLLKSLDRNVIFTGIIKSAGESRALIRERKNKKDSKNYSLKVGGTVMDMTLQEIGNNYIVLTGLDMEVRLNLFKSRKDRPVAPKIKLPVPDKTGKGAAQQPAVATNSPVVNANKLGGNAKFSVDKNQKEKNDAASGNSQPNDSIPSNAPSAETPKASAVNPFVQALQKSRQNSINNGGGTSISGGAGSTNPFLDAIKRAREQQQ